MDLSTLKPSPGSKKSKKRVGRGHGCHVKTAGRGQKGQNSRSGGGKKPGFEGGQTPWYRRLPKYKGFKSLNRVEYALVNLSHLESFENGAVVTPETLLESGVLKKAGQVKVLGGGTLSKQLTVHAHKFTQAAQQSIEAAGGKAEVI